MTVMSGTLPIGRDRAIGRPLVPAPSWTRHGRRRPRSDTPVEPETKHKEHFHVSGMSDENRRRRRLRRPSPGRGRRAPVRGSDDCTALTQTSSRRRGFIGAQPLSNASLLPRSASGRGRHCRHSGAAARTTTISTRRQRAGWRARPTCTGTAPPGSAPSTAANAAGVRFCGPRPTAPTAVSASGRLRSPRAGPSAACPGADCRYSRRLTLRGSASP